MLTEITEGTENIFRSFKPFREPNFSYKILRNRMVLFGVYNVHGNNGRNRRYFLHFSVHSNLSVSQTLLSKFVERE
jgi:hypothetical protein